MQLALQKAEKTKVIASCTIPIETSAQDRLAYIFGSEVKETHLRFSSNATPTKNAKDLIKVQEGKDRHRDYESEHFIVTQPQFGYSSNPEKVNANRQMTPSQTKSVRYQFETPPHVFEGNSFACREGVTTSTPLKINESINTTNSTLLRLQFVENLVHQRILRLPIPDCVSILQDSPQEARSKFTHEQARIEYQKRSKSASSQYMRKEAISAPIDVNADDQIAEITDLLPSSTETNSQKFGLESKNTTSSNIDHALISRNKQKEGSPLIVIGADKLNTRERSRSKVKSRQKRTRHSLRFLQANEATQVDLSSSVPLTQNCSEAKMKQIPKAGPVRMQIIGISAKLPQNPTRRQIANFYRKLMKRCASASDPINFFAPKPNE
ncbi:hypothetical protein PUMCH_005002 [Australozyma saopauloensis]|uniref:Uncharacterized protein n=1 Tax=Australozyma saopauloensis TaxID=291208 RepID=A0AAX4HGV1_9ASCO|nr:hypothetical protein PUMCH_005002 [[Candida] saopauloensis]